MLIALDAEVPSSDSTASWTGAWSGNADSELGEPLDDSGFEPAAHARRVALERQTKRQEDMVRGRGIGVGSECGDSEGVGSEWEAPGRRS